MAQFTVECFQNEYLPVGAGDVNAILTVTATTVGRSAASANREAAASVVMLIDVSGSMNGEKIRQARKAAIAAVDCLRDGVHFAVVAGNEHAFAVYPTSGLAVSSPRSRKEAHKQLQAVRAGGGTRISLWLNEACDLLAAQPGIRQAILLTDGKNESEAPEDLELALEQASKVFQCDCRGVGTDWSVAELTRISEVLMGTVDIVADPANLTADFEAVMLGTMRKAVSDVRLRVWVPQGARIEYVKQVAPTLIPLKPDDDGGPAWDYSLGSWAEESRDYHLNIRVVPAGVGDEMLASRVSLIVDGEVAAQSLVRATWTEDTAVSTRLNRQVAHYTGQQELADAIQTGLDARARGDDGTAMVKLGRAVQLAAASGNKEVGELLEKVVAVEDATTGRVRLKQQVTDADRMTLETRSRRTARVRR